MDLPSVTPEDPTWHEKMTSFVNDWVQKGKDKAADLAGKAHQTLQNYTTLRVKKLTETALLLSKAHTGDLGIDLFCDSIEYNGQIYDNVKIRPTFDKNDIPPLSPFKIHTGIALGFPTGYGGLILDRSSLGSKGLRTLAGLIDNAYIGEIVVCAVWTNNFMDFEIKKGDKIAQLVLLPCTNFPLLEVDDLGQTDRGGAGFGSTGK